MLFTPVYTYSNLSDYFVAVFKKHMSREMRMREPARTTDAKWKKPVEHYELTTQLSTYHSFCY